MPEPRPLEPSDVRSDGRGTPPRGVATDDAPQDGGPAAPVEGAPGASMVVGRRSFFRQLVGEAMQAAGSLSGVATVATGAAAGAAAAARELDAADRLSSAPRGPSMEQLARTHLAGVVAPWTWDADRVLLLDQRRLPGVEAAFPVATAAAAARAIGDRAVTGPSAAVVAAWGLRFARTVAAARGGASSSALVSGARTSLLAADPGSHVLRHTLAGPGAADVDAALLPDADAVLAMFQAEHRRLAVRVAELMAARDVVAPLLHGECGALWGAGCGIGTDAVLLARAARDVVAPLVTEGRPWSTGGRITCWELARAGVPATLLMDAAAAGVIGRGGVDLVVCIAERVAADGSVCLPVGAQGLALAAVDRGVPFVVAAAAWAFDPSVSTAAELADDVAAATVAASAVMRPAGSPIAPPGTHVDTTRFDVVAAHHITELVIA